MRRRRVRCATLQWRNGAASWKNVSEKTTNFSKSNLLESFWNNSFNRDNSYKSFQYSKIEARSTNGSSKFLLNLRAAEMIEQEMIRCVIFRRCHDASSCFLFFFFPPLNWREEIEKLDCFVSSSGQFWNNLDSFVAAPLEHIETRGCFGSPSALFRCTVHVCHPAIRHASGFKYVLRSRVLIHVNARYISTRCLYCAHQLQKIQRSFYSVT